MSSIELSKKLQEQEAKLLSTEAQLDALYREAQAIMPYAASAWIDDEVKRRVSEFPAVIQSLGIEKLREIKNKIKELKNNLVEIVASEFEDQSKWSHHVANIERIPQNEKLHLNNIFRNVISNLGGILVEYGLEGELAEYDLTEELARQFPPWKSVGAGRFRYSMNPRISGKLDIKLREYNKLLGEYNVLRQEIKNTKKAIFEAEANELWEKA